MFALVLISLFALFVGHSFSEGMKQKTVSKPVSKPGKPGKSDSKSDKSGSKPDNLNCYQDAEKKNIESGNYILGDEVVTSQGRHKCEKIRSDPVWTQLGSKGSKINKGNSIKNI